MKKFVNIMLFCMIFAVGQAYAQDSISFVQANETYAETRTNTNDLQQLIPLLSALSEKMSEGGEVPEPKGTFPVIGKSKFAQHHHIYQTIEISTIVGKDKDRDDDSDDVQDNKATDGTSTQTTDVISNLNLGMNIGYRLLFVPGIVQGENLVVNRFGFAYSVGLIAAFDRQDDYDVTCDFLGKVGIETGNGHAIGMGVDYLIGTGKTAGTLFFENDPAPYPYTMWCFKQGFQVWLNTNLLTTAMGDADILAFGRFVHSKNPLDDLELAEDGISNFWLEESWQFGVTFRVTLK